MSIQLSRHSNQYTHETRRYHFLLKNNVLEVLVLYEARQYLKAMIYMVLSVHDINPVFDTKITTTAS